MPCHHGPILVSTRERKTASVVTARAPKPARHATLKLSPGKRKTAVTLPPGTKPEAGPRTP